MSQETITPESACEKLTKMLKREVKSRKLIAAIGLIAIALAAGYFCGYQQGYHEALIDFKLIEATVLRV